MRDRESRITDLRLDNDFKQLDVSKKLNVKYDTYSKWERGINDIPIQKSNELANLYNVSLDYLFGLSDYSIITPRKEIDLKVLCERLLELRKSKQLSQESLAEQIGFHQRTYSHYEDGSRLLTTYKIYHIAVYYKVSMDYLVGRTDDKEIKVAD